MCSESQKIAVFAEVRSLKSQRFALSADGGEFLLYARNAASNSHISPLGFEWPVVLNVRIGLERGEVLIHNPQVTLSNASSAAKNGQFLPPEIAEVFVRSAAHILSILENATRRGVAGQPQSETGSLDQEYGNSVVVLSGREIEELVSDVELSTREAKDSTRSTTSQVGQSSQIPERSLAIWCSSVIRAINSYIPGETRPMSSFAINLTLTSGHTLVPYHGKLMADGPRYKMIGNGFAVPVVAWIGRRIKQVESSRIE